MAALAAPAPIPGAPTVEPTVMAGAVIAPAGLALAGLAFAANGANAPPPAAVA